MLWRFFLFVCLTSVSIKAHAENLPYVLILNYAAFDSSAEDNVSFEEFEKHLSIIKESKFDVIDLGDVKEFLATNKDGHAVVLTFEDIDPNDFYKTEALLNLYGFPYTVFMSLNEGDILKNFDMSYENIGIHPAYYDVEVNKTRFLEKLNRSYSEYKNVTGQPPAYFSFPHGLYTAEIKQALKNYPFKAVIGGGNGLATDDDIDVLPKFEMTSKEASPDRFRALLNLKPMAVSDVLPEETLLTSQMASIGFTINDKIENEDELKCFMQEDGYLPITFLNSSRAELRTRLKPHQKNIINCVLKLVNVQNETGYEWLGFILQDASDFIRPHELPALQE